MPITVKCHSKHRNLLGCSFEIHPIILYIGSFCHLSYILLFILVMLAFSKKKGLHFYFSRNKSPKKKKKQAGSPYKSMTFKFLILVLASLILL